MQYINNIWQEGQGESFSSFNPANGEKICTINAASTKQVEAAIKSARAAFEEWGFLEREQRISIVQKMADSLQKNLEKLAHAITLDNGKPLWEAKFEVNAAIGKIANSIAAYNERTPEKVLTNARLSHRPHGVVVVFSPFNYPIHMPNSHLAPALLAGNCVILKPSEAIPHISQIYMEAMAEAGFPKGVINMVQGGRDVGIALTQNDDINGVYFTGSTQVGIALSKYFADKTGKILALEMGGNNPIIVHQPKDIKAAVYHVINSAYITSGQRCTCARRLLLTKHESNQEFINQLASAIAKIKVGDGFSDPQPFIGPVISAAAADGLVKAQQNLLDMGAKAVAMGRKEGYAFFTPSLLDVSGINVPDDEHFGPMLQMKIVANLDEAIAAANDTKFGLSASIISDDIAAYEKYRRKTRSGLCNWNLPTTGASGALPFGGTGLSGNHRPSAYYAADYAAYPLASQESGELKIPAAIPPGLEF